MYVEAFRIETMSPLLRLARPEDLFILWGIANEN